MSIKSLGVSLILSVFVASAFASPKVIKKIPPEYPSAATKKGINSGTVKMSLTIDAQGNVTDVKLLEASPENAKIFNNAAVEALKQWKFEAGNASTLDVQLVFKQED